MNLTLQTIPSTLISELLTYSDIDGVVLDTEHGYFNAETLYSCIQVITLRNKKCFVRFTDLNRQLVRLCLDAGVDGVIFSTVETLKDSVKILEFCRYPSQGGKRGCGLVRENMWGAKQLDLHQPLIIAQIETSEAVDNIETIKNCEFDMFLIGPYDLSSSLKVPGEFQNINFLEYLEKIRSSIPSSKLGMFLPTRKDIDNYLSNEREKAGMLILGMDTNFILESLKNINI
jgi:4-hydroxy-2-oxoheptanedioate aldolase